LRSTGDGPGRAVPSRWYRHGYARVFLAACLLLVAALTTVAMYQSCAAAARSRDEGSARAQARGAQLSECASALEGAARCWAGSRSGTALDLVARAGKALSRAERSSEGPTRLRLQALQRDLDDVTTLMRGGDSEAEACLRQLTQSVRAVALSDEQ